MKGRVKCLLFCTSIFLLFFLCIQIIHSSDEKWIDVTEIGTDSEAIQKVLDIAKSKGKVQIIFPEGYYDINKTLVVYNNTHIKLDDKAILLRKFPGTILRNGDTGAMYSEYKGNGNIIIEGGVIDGNVLEEPYGKHGFGGISIAHAENVIISDVTIKDIVYSHAIEINSSYNVTIENCTFLGFKDNTTDGGRSFSEAIQVDSASKNGYPAFGFWDKTPSKNVLIENNYFGKGETFGMRPWPVAVGGHGALEGVSIQNIQIYNNTFVGMTFAAIRPYKWIDVDIRYNNFIDVKRPVLID